MIISLINQRLSLTLVSVEIKHLSDKESKSVTFYQCNQICRIHYRKKITLLHQVITFECLNDRIVIVRFISWTKKLIFFVKLKSCVCHQQIEDLNWYKICMEL